MDDYGLGLAPSPNPEAHFTPGRCVRSCTFGGAGLDKSTIEWLRGF